MLHSSLPQSQHVDLRGGLGIAVEGTPLVGLVDFTLAFRSVRAFCIWLIVDFSPERGLHWNDLGLPQSLRSWQVLSTPQFVLGQE